MADYSIQQESRRILSEAIRDTRLRISPEVAAACADIEFIGDSKPFIPTPCKITESSSVLSGLVGALAAVVAKERYGVDQKVTIDTDKATLFLMSVFTPTINGKSFFEHKQLRDELSEADKYDMAKPLHRQATNIYQAKDGRWYHLHASMNAGPTMKMLGVPEQDVSTDEARAIYAAKVAEWNSADIEREANDVYKQAGTVCNTPEEFFETPQGKIMGAEPLYTMHPTPAPIKAWPSSDPKGYRPLAGIKVIDFSRVIAAPAVSKLLAALGADVLKVSWSGNPELEILLLDMNTGKRDVDINMKTEEGKKVFNRLVKDADILIDGFRPGAFDRLGYPSSFLRELNPSLIVMRENCYGFKGPLAYRSGWQQISDCVVGISWLQGKFLGLNEPVVPLLPNSDYQTGLTGAAAAIQALIIRTKEPVTFDIDISLTQYNIWYYRLGQYDAEMSKALLARNPGFAVRHYDEMVSLIGTTYKSLAVSRPGLAENPAYHMTMSGREWGIEEDIQILAPPFDLEKSEVGYDVPSGRRGRSSPEWR